MAVHGIDSSLSSVIANVMQEFSLAPLNIAYNVLDIHDGVFFNCVLLDTDKTDAAAFVKSLQDSLNHWHQKLKDRQVLRIALEFSPDLLDPRIGLGSNSGEVIKLLFEGLTRYHHDGHIENAIAESIEISPDLKSYLFKLRYSMWNDGSPLTAYDFEYAWKKVLSPDFKTSFAHLFYPIKNAQAVKEGKVSLDQIGIKAIDERHLKVDLERPTPYFLQSVAHPLYSPVHHLIDQQHPQWPYECDKNYPCNGPFQMKFNQPNQGYQLVKNPYYWDVNEIVLDQINLTIMNPTQALQAFRRKEVDWIGNPFGIWHSFYPHHDENVILSPNFWVCWCVFNTVPLPFNHLKFRQAIAYAIKRSEITSNAFVRLTPAFSALPDDNNTSPYLYPDYDKEYALKLFEEAMAELGTTKEELPPLTLLFLEKGILEHTAICLKQQLESCFGIRCELKPATYKNLFQQLVGGDYQIALTQWTSWISDPIYTLDAFKSVDRDVNFSKWENKEFKELLELSEQEVNPFQRSAYLRKSEKILTDQMPVIPLFYQPKQALINKDLHIVFKPLGGLFSVARGFFKKEE